MNEKFLKRYNQQQRQEIQRVYDEIKWYLGEELKRDPSNSDDDKKIIECRLADIIINGFGKYLSVMALQSLDTPQATIQVTGSITASFS